jgi:exopolysaccharide production protein ExoQ
LAERAEVVGEESWVNAALILKDEVSKMGPTVGVGILICILFWLDRDNVPVSKAFWLSYAWLLIASSRPISAWLTLSAPGYPGDAYIDGSPLDRNALTFLLIVGLYALSKRTRQVRTILSANPQIIIFFMYCLISLLWSDYPFVVFKRWTRSVGDIVVILVIITESNWASALKRLLTSVGFVLIPLSILFIRFYPSLGRAYSVGGAPSWTGVGTDKNALGMICMVFGVSLLWRGLITYNERLDKRRTRKLVAISIVFVMILYLVLVVNSQTALACFLMADLLIIVTAFGPAFRKPAIVSSLVVGMLTVSFCVLFLGIGGSALSALGRDSSLTGRTEVWKTVLPYATNPLFGAGYENFWIGERLQLFTRIIGGLNQAHNGYIEIYLNLGWVGLILLSAIIVVGYRNIMKDLRRDPEMGRLKLAFFFICLVYNFTEASFKMQSPVWIFFLWAAMAAPKPRALSRIRPSAIQNTYVVEVVGNGEQSSLSHWTRA